MIVVLAVEPTTGTFEQLDTFRSQGFDIVQIADDYRRTLDSEGDGRHICCYEVKRKIVRLAPEKE